MKALPPGCVAFHERTRHDESGRVVYTDVLQQIYKGANEMYGTDYQPPN